MKELERGLQETAKELLTSKKVELLIGYERGTLPLRARPCFLTGVEEVGRLVWNIFCHNNLATYLPKLFIPPGPIWRGEASIKRVGIVANGCISRTIVEQIKEKRFNREDVFIIGIPCQGMIERRKIERRFKDGEIVEAREEAGELIILDDKGKEVKIKIEEILADNCLSCQYKSPIISDLLLAVEKREERKREKYLEVKEMEGKPPEERWNYFEKEMSRCIRCYACRNACPLCYCPECFAEQSQPRWIGVTDDPSDVKVFHIIRIFHTAGRCLDCGACVQACPLGIDLRRFTNKMIKDVEELFGYEAGISLEEPSLLSTYKLDDPQDFITEPE